MRTLALVATLALGLVLGMAREAHACAGCRNPSLPASRGSSGPLPAGDARYSASLTATAIHVVHEAGCVDPADCVEAPVQPLHLHDQHLYPVELRIGAELGMTDAFGVELQAPIRLVRTTIDYTTPDGAPYEPLDAGVHHRDETIVGPADLWLLGRIGAVVADWWLALRLGASLPFGQTERDPFALGDQGLRHQHVQLGSGTVDPVGVVEAVRSFGPIEAQVFAQGQVPLYESARGYRGPWRIYGGGGIGSALIGKLRGSLGVEAFHEAEERWGGVARQDGSLGRSELLGAVSLVHAFGDTQLSIAARVPVWRHVVRGSEDPGSLSSPLALTLAIAHVLRKPR